METEIARLEKELASNGHLDDLNASDILTGMPTRGAQELDFNFNTSPTKDSQGSVPDTMKESIMTCAEIQALIKSTIPMGCGLTDLVSRVRMGLTPSTAMASDGRSHVSTRSSFSKQTDTMVKSSLLRGIPTHIVKSLIKKYLQKILPIYPVVHEFTVYKQLDMVLQTLAATDNPVVPPSYEFLTIYLMLAISTTLGSVKSADESRCMAFSGSLFEEGMHHLTIRSHVPSDLAGLQITLLILQYATINPRRANVWILSGAAMRSCLELGLHREPPKSSSLDPLTLDLRRRVFWCAYGMDRAVCSALQRPLSIPDPAISVEYFSALDDKHIHEDGIDSTGTETKHHALRWVAFRRLQSSMIEVHFQNKPLEPGQSWDDWLRSIEGRLRDWYDGYSNSHELTDFTLAHCLATLHRPSPRKPFPAPRSLEIAFEAASASAKALRQHISCGFYRRTWLLAHHTLESAMIVLFCLRHGSETISKRFDSHQIFEMTKLFTANFLAIASQGWNEVSNYAGVYERLLGPLLESTFSGKPPPQHSFGPGQDAELLRLLYPGPAQLDKLRFGTRAHDLIPEFDLSLFNPDEWNVNDALPDLDFIGMLGNSGSEPEPLLPEGL